MGKVINMVRKPMTDFSPANYTKKVSAQVGNALTECLDLDRAAQGEFEMTDKECQKFRQRLYQINRDHPRGYKFKTMRDGRLLCVWRVR